MSSIKKIFSPHRKKLIIRFLYSFAAKAYNKGRATKATDKGGTT
jgi:hypothetical protein